MSLAEYVCPAIPRSTISANLIDWRANSPGHVPNTKKIHHQRQSTASGWETLFSTTYTAWFATMLAVIHFCICMSWVFQFKFQSIKVSFQIFRWKVTNSQFSKWKKNSVCRKTKTRSNFICNFYNFWGHGGVTFILPPRLTCAVGDQAKCNKVGGKFISTKVEGCGLHRFFIFFNYGTGLM